MKILWATAIYSTPMFNTFLYDFLHSLEAQTQHKFDLLFFLDCIPKEVIVKNIQNFNNLAKKKYFLLEQSSAVLSPQEIRVLLLKKAQQLDYDLLIFSDFDEISETNRVEETLKQINHHDVFYFNSFVSTNFHLERNTPSHFYLDKQIPKYINSHMSILDKNYIGMGNIAFIVKKIPFNQLEVPSQIIAFDWFLATWLLLNNFHGMRIDNTLNSYRQHQDSFIGIGEQLCQQKLILGISVKKEHYKYFLHYDPLFSIMYQEILEVEKYVQKNMEKYIKIINEKFDSNTMCWWENIKTLEEIKQWI